MNGMYKTMLAVSTLLTLSAGALGSANAANAPRVVYPHTHNASAKDAAMRADASAAQAPAEQAVYDVHGRLLGFTGTTSQPF